AFLTSTVPEPKVISAKVLGANVTLKAQAVVDFQPAQQTPDRMIVLSGNAQVGVVGEPLPQPFVIKCIDIAGMPMRSCDVRFEVTDGDGHFGGQRGITVRVAGDGLASALLTLGRTAGVRTLVRVSSPGMNNSPLTLYAESRRGEASQLFIAGGDRQVGAPNTELPMPLTVQVTDRFGNPVESYPVEFSVKTGDAVVNGSRSAALQTDAQGKAQVKVKLGSQVGSVLVEARTGFSSVIFSLQTADNRPEADLQRSTLICTSPVPADGVSRSQVIVTLLDKNGNPVVGQAVHLVVIGEAAQVVQADSLSDLQGIVRGYITSTAVGVKIVLAYLMPENLVLEQRGLVEFKRYQAILSLVSGNGQQGIVGQKPAEPLQVRVTSDGIALPRQAVQFIVVSGGGHFNGCDSLIVETDADGLALAEPVLGVIAGMNRFLARLPQAGSPTVTFNVQGMPDMPYALSRIQGENQTASVRMPLPQKFVVAVRDRYNNPCPNTAVFFEALDGGTILTPQPVVSDSTGRAECQAALGTREGRYTFKASVRSGAFVIYTATAVNSNRPPIIIGKRPFDSTVPFHYGDRLTFEITQVYDPDEDPIHYTWYLNDKPIGSQSSFSLYMNSSFPQTNRVRCVVSDGLDAVEVVWTLVLQTKVEVSSFTAHFMPPSNVELKWHISTMTDIAGFNLYRKGEQEERKKINATLIQQEGGEYRFRDDDNLQPGTYVYDLEAVDRTGALVQVDSASVTVAAPQQFVLRPSYPNPFNPTTTIAFDLPKEGQVSVCIYDGRGRLVRQLADNFFAVGRHSLTWDACDEGGNPVPSGIYVVTVAFNGERHSGKLTLLK
ncbi:MAG: Ig-like domain-containing protein, partial [candidate division KSB1 bacterium]|nr:Ig-like domain-containing protein [candidate division KSB1 bacterium]